MEKIERHVAHLYKNRQQRELDIVLPIVGDEGTGKSTLMLSIAIVYSRMRDGVFADPEALLNRIYFERDDWKHAMSESEKRALIMVPDAARMLYSKDAMHGDQKEIEKDLMDVRGLEFFIMLGYQDFDSIPKQVKERRAKYCIFLPDEDNRGYAEAYDREQMDDRVENGEWPDDPLYTDRFPALDGTEYWQQYQRLDEEQKRQRLQSNTTPEPEDVSRDEQRKVVIRAVKPWDQSEGMTQRDASKLVDYSESWVSETVRDWKDGEYRDLVEMPEVAIA